MPIRIPLPVANPSPFRRHDYVEVDLSRLPTLAGIPDRKLRLVREQDGAEEPIAHQIDYPLGVDKPRRVMTFYCKDLPPGPDDYSQKAVTFYLDDQGSEYPPPADSPLWIEHYYAPGDHSRGWYPDKPVIGVKLGNGIPHAIGLELYFSLIPRPGYNPPFNYAGALTSVLHHRADRCTSHGASLSPICFENEAYARWGQITRLEFYPLPWEPRFYHVESMLSKDGIERHYDLVYSHVGPHRATVTLKSEPFTLSYVGQPIMDVPEVHLTCRLYRVISVFPHQEYYTEQLLVCPENDLTISIAFRAHFGSHVDINAKTPLREARQEAVPDYFAVWLKGPGDFPPPFSFNYGFGFASDSHIRAFDVKAPNMSWRLQLGHEPRCVHYFLFENHKNFGESHTIGHDGWYLRLFKPVEMPPFTRYLKHQGSQAFPEV